MDEYIPQLTLTPDLNAQPQPEVKKEEDLITKAQAAPEAGPDLSALSEQEQQAVLAFSKQIDLENAQQILEYGASAQKNIADFSDTALAKVKTAMLLIQKGQRSTRLCTLHHAALSSVYPRVFPAQQRRCRRSQPHLYRCCRPAG